MANTVTFSVGGFGGGGVIKSIQHIPFRVDDYQRIDGFCLGSPSNNVRFYQISINLDHAVDPDKTIVIYPQNIYMVDNPDASGYTSLENAVIVLSKITENSIKFMKMGSVDDSNNLPDQIIQVIEFE